MFVFRSMRTGTNVKGFGLMSHVPCNPLKESVLSDVHIMERGNPGQTIQNEQGTVNVRVVFVLRSIEVHPVLFQ